MTTSARRGLAAAIVVGTVVADVATKQWAVGALADGPIWLVGNSVGFVLARNSGSAFLSLLSSATPVLALLAIVAAVVLARAVARTSDPWMLVGLSLFLGGALGNLVDRVFRAPGPLRGAVVDFVKVGPWPLFNVADSAITVGAVLVAIAVLRDRPDHAPGAPDAGSHADG
ncbi:MAG: signal peptidase II [Actinomycetes bacterium]